MRDDAGLAVALGAPPVSAVWLLVGKEWRGDSALEKNRPSRVSAAGAFCRDQLVMCAVCSAWLNIAFSAAVISAGELAV